MKKEVVAIRKRVPFYDNLVKPFNKWEFIGQLTSSVIKSQGYELLFTAKELGEQIYEYIKIDPLGVYTLQVDSMQNGVIYVQFCDENKNVISNATSIQEGVYKATYIVPFNAHYLKILPSSLVVNGDVVFKNLILVNFSASVIEFFPNEEKRVIERMKDNGTVQEIRVRFYPGVEKSLQVSPYILHKAGRREELFTYPTGTDGFISGDNDDFVFPVSIDFQYDDELVVEYKNIGDYIYTLSCDIIVNYWREEVNG